MEFCRRRAIYNERAKTDKQEVMAVMTSPVIENIEIDDTSSGKTDMKNTCKKCGKYCKRGLFIHEKYCKGA